MASDADDSGGEDFEALEAIRRACIFTGTDPQSLRPSSSVDVDEDEDDFELVRGIRQRFNECCSDAGDEAPLTLKPLSMLIPAMEDDDDEEDDFAILRRIQKRFSCYDQDADGLESSKEKEEQVCSKNTYPMNEASCSVELDKTNTTKAVPDSLDMHNISDTPETLDTATPDTFPSCLSEACETDSHDLVMVPTEACGFPKAAQMFVDAIRKNRACQKFIRNKMMQTEARIEENKKLQYRIKVLRGFQIKCKKQTTRALSQQQDARIQLISASKAKGKSKANGKKDPALCHGPAENSRVACYRMVLSEYQMSLSRRKWTEEERRNLAKGIKQQFQELLLQRSVDSISEMVGDSDEVDSLYASIKERDISSKDMRLFIPKVNWERLATMYVKGRSGAECEARWLNWEDPLINHKRWTNSEDKKLLHIVQQRGVSNWIEIAVLLETNRTPFQCLARYQRSLNASVLRSEWSKDEDEKLRVAVIALGESNWENVATTLVGRTGPQCSNRWIKSLNPARERTGKWSSDEDKRVKVAVVFFGPKNWRKVAQFVPGRTHVQCRERWANNLDPSLSLGEWTEEEDSKLKAAIQEYGYCWSKVAACVPSRTDNQCTRRWKTLFPHEVPLLQDARKIQKAALISNFVDRESERPALGPNDFVPLQLTNADFESGELNQSGKQRRKPRSKKASKETQFCNDEVLPTNDVDVERDSGENANLKKKLIPRRRKNKKASEVTEDTRVGEEILPTDLETKKKVTRRKQKISSRSKKGTKDAVVCTSEVLSTDGVDVEKVAGVKTNLKKKPTRRRHKNNNGASEATEDARAGQEIVRVDVEKVAGEKTNSNNKLIEATEDARVDHEIVPIDGADVEKVVGEKTNSKKKPTKATKDARACQEIVPIDSGDVEKVAGKKSTSKKKPTRCRHKNNNGASEATGDARTGQEIVPIDVEAKKRETRRGLKKAVNEALILTDETLLTNSVDVEKVSGSKKKLTPRRRKKNNGASEAPEAARVGQEIMPFNGETKKNKTLKKSKMASRGGPKEKDRTATSRIDMLPDVEQVANPCSKKSSETNSRVSTCGDSEVLNVTNIEAAGGHTWDRIETENKRSSENKKNKQCKRYEEAASSFGENETSSEVRKFSSSRVEQDHTDPTEVNSSPFSNSKSLKAKEGFQGNGKRRKGSVMSRASRIKCSALLREVSDIAEISDSETLGSMVLKKMEMRRSLKKLSHQKHSSVKSGSVIQKKVDTIERGALLEISTAGENIESTARGDSSYCRKRKDPKPQSKKSENIKLGNKFSIVDRGCKRKRSSIGEQLCCGNKLGEEKDDTTLASFIKKIQKKRRLNLVEVFNEPSRIGWL